MTTTSHDTDTRPQLSLAIRTPPASQLPQPDPDPRQRLEAWRESNPLRRLRRQYVGSQAALARSIGRSGNAAYRWEDGSRRPDRSSVFLLAQVFGVDPAALDELLDGWLARRPTGTPRPRRLC